MHRNRNGKIIDIWSLAHFLEGVVLALILPPWAAFALLVLWEPFENFVLSPLLWKHFKINFGHESLQNALSDILFDSLGILTTLLFINFL